MRRKRGALSIRVKILLLFVLSLLIAVSSFAELIFSSWTAYARESTRSNAERINEDLYDQVSSFVQAPFQMNEVSRKFQDPSRFLYDVAKGLQAHYTNFGGNVV